MKYRLLLFYLLIGFFSHGKSGETFALAEDQICSASELDLPAVGAITKDELHFIPFIPRKTKSKAREVLEIPHVFVIWYSNFFRLAELLFVQSINLCNSLNNLFLRGPPCDGPPVLA